MFGHSYFCLYIAAAFVVSGTAGAFAAAEKPAIPSINPAAMTRIGTIDERFLSYNIEMLEVTGGRFWKPYNQTQTAAAQPQALQSSTPPGMSPDLYQYRPPIDLSNARRRKLAAALGPAYVRVSGTWANNTYFQDSDGPPMQKPPAGFSGVLTRKEWKAVIDFAHAANAEIVTSFATSVGTRDASGVWTPAEAEKFLAFTKSAGGSIAAAEFMNEPTFAVIGGAPKGYNAADYGRDISVFVPFIRKAAPDMLILGPGSVGEGGPLSMPSMPGFIKSEDMLKATGPVFDAFSYHFYGAVSQRCAKTNPRIGTSAGAALTDEWLARTDGVEAFYAKLRDQFDPGKPLWLTETADAACGGNPWASTFLDTFRYLNQLGTLAQRGVQVVMHNTLDASDYGLIDETTLEPRPNYWAALLWHNLMGTTVLNPSVPASPGLHVYAHCLKGKPGGVAMLVINADRDKAQSLTLPAKAARYTLSASQLTSAQVKLNGHTLQLGSGDSLPQLTGAVVDAGKQTVNPVTIMFLTFPEVKNASCYE